MSKQTELAQIADVVTVSGSNVGIGTSSPTSPLEIYLSTDISMNASATGHLEIQGNGYGAAIALDAQGVNIYNNSSSRGIIFGTNETERMRIDSSGRVTMPYQPNFVAYRNTGSWYNTTTERKMEFNSATINVGNYYNTSNYRFTAPVAGTYKFELIVYSRNDNTSDSSDYATIQLRLNGASSYTTHAYWIMHYKNNGDGDANFVMPYTVYLNAGDYIEPYYQAYSGSFSWHHTNSRFTGYLLG